MVPYHLKYKNFLDRLKKTEFNKSCDEDNLNLALLKNRASAFPIPLFLIFKESLEKAIFHKKSEKTLTMKLSVNIACSFCFLILM